MDSLDVTLPANASPPDFDFNLPCGYFKSSFARSLSLNNNNNNSLCKSLDYDIRSTNQSGGGNSNSHSLLTTTNTTTNGGLKREVPPIPQKRTTQDGTSSSSSLSYQSQNEANAIKRPVKVEFDELIASAAAAGNTNGEQLGAEKPPALPARRPLGGSVHANATTTTQSTSVASEQQKMQQASLTQLRQQAFNQALSNSNSAVLPVNVSVAAAQQHQQQQQQQQFTQKRINHYPASIGHNSNNNANDGNNICSSNFRRNINVWPNKPNVEQDYTYYDADNDDDINSEYHGTTKLSANSVTNSNRHQSHQQPPQKQHTSVQLMIPIIMTNQQQQQYDDVPPDNTTNVEAVILQNQVDTLHWQLKQVETSCDMYRAVMEEVARFLERYQKQRQLQQQQQLQHQQQLAAQKHSNCNGGTTDQMPRSKSLYQVYAPGGGLDKSSSHSNSIVDDSSASYLRVRSSTNLIDLKQNGSNNKLTNATGLHSKDDHNFETGLAPAQSYSAFKDFTWRRSPKKANDSRTNNGRDDVDEKLNQEAFRLLRTIHNLLNTSQHQPDIAHPNHQNPLPHHQQHLFQRHSLAPGTALNMGRMSKAISTCSVATLPGAPMHNSTSLTLMGSNCAASTTSDSSAASPTIAAPSNTLAPEILFLRSVNMRDSRLSLRSSTDSSVHSTSSAASSASSKVETDEEPTTPFHSPPNILAHKQHHLAGSSTEDESGFSSISSFPDIGVPLNSTMLSSTPSSKGRPTMGKELKFLKACSDRDHHQQQPLTTDSRNSTLKANVVGLPLNSSQDMSHRWDSPSKTYHNASTKFQRFSALSNEDSNTVLWV